ncbi:leucine-rich repeat-containing protein 45 isoform X3 [Equus asinus]|uniref:leucine-rich repeat-containing protein 45 isoform X3 n=1 Tax=Equus asinus TaxID=9793 RepID=UPI001D03D2BF|nr:leucine-rich repeat-containing protein 45 isoform X3 [Equus asinus]
MEELRRSYSRLCKESGAEPQEGVLQQLHELPRGRLDLATQSLTVDTCRALGKLLQKEALLTQLVLSDCMLSEEGATLLLQGLCTNTTVRFLDLKGNNLRAAGAEALGKLLRQSKSIQRALASNGSLQQLDLRNNQISHKGAEELALALKSNASLQQLDLRWNNIGLLGGRALVNCLPSNRTLWRLELAGNSVPGDILRAVEQAMDHNQDRQTTFRENQARAHVLSKEMRHLREEKSKQFLDLMETIDKQREEMARSSRASAARVGQLQEALNERHSIINALKAKLQMAEATLVLSEQKAQDLGELLATAEQEQRSLVQRQAKEHRLEQQVGRHGSGRGCMVAGAGGILAPSHPQEAAERESKLLRDLSAANEKNLLLQSQSAWTWRRRGLDRAWRTQSSCVSRRCLMCCVTWPLAFPGLHPGQADASVWHGVPKAHPWLGSLNNLGLLDGGSLPALLDVSPATSRPGSRRDPDRTRATAQAAVCSMPPGVWCWDVPSIVPSCEATWGSQFLEGTGSPRFTCLPGWGSHREKAEEPACQPLPRPTPGQVEHMTRHLEESEKAMQERVQRLEAARLSLEEELSRVKAVALNERGQAEEELIKAKNQVRLEEQQRLAHLEEKLRLLAQARDEAQSTCLQQKQTVADAQARASQLGQQVEGLRRRLEELQQELSNKDQERVAEVTRVRVELQEQNGRLQAELTAQEALKEKAAALERQLKVMASDHREALLDRESENACLREKLRLKEAEITRIRDEEAQRASFLQNAVLAYVQGSPLRALSPQK